MSALVVKRPWKLFDFGGYQIGAAADGEAVCTMWGDREEAIANAAYLTEAVNSYDTLRAENERLRNAGNAIRRWAMPSGLDPEIDADMRAWDQLVALSEAQP